MIEIEHLSGYINCKFNFGQYTFAMTELSFLFESKLYYLYGEIDSGNWAISYLLSHCNDKDNMIWEEAEYTLNSQPCTLFEIGQHCCYISKSHNNMFREKTRKTVKHFVEKNLAKSKVKLTVEEIRNLFEIDESRFERPIYQTGNMSLRCAAAIGLAADKQVYCFPWFSKKMYRYYKPHIIAIVDALRSQNRTILLPTSHEMEFEKSEDIEYIEVKDGYI